MSSKVLDNAFPPEPTLKGYIGDGDKPKTYNGIGKIGAKTYQAKQPAEVFEIENYKWFDDKFRPGQHTLSLTVTNVSSGDKFYVTVNKTNAQLFGDYWGSDSVDDWIGHRFKIPRVDRSNPQFPTLVLVPTE